MAESAASYDFLGPPAEHGDLGSLGHYRVISEVGKGGMGYVFLAEDSKLKRPVALKVMNQKIAATAHSRRRFVREARAMAAVHHDNVATIFEVGESKGTPFMAMELLEGSTLELFNQGDERLGYERIIDIALQTAEGLAAAHSKGIIHRDIKPANIWIEKRNERIKILDFGLALASSPVDHLAGRGAVIGTPGYLSPEQARSEPLDDRSDLYSLGVVLYELCTGQLPLQSDSVPGQLIAILAHRPERIGELNPEIPRPLCDLIHKLLRKEPRSRVSSAAQLCHELEQARVDCEQPDQLGPLQSTAGDSSDRILFDDIDQSIPDPLAVGAAQTGADPFATSTFAASARPAVSARPTREPPEWLSYWPIAAVALAAIIALPMMTYVFSNMGGSTAPIAADELIAQPNKMSQAEVVEFRRKAGFADNPVTPVPGNSVAGPPSSLVTVPPSNSASRPPDSLANRPLSDSASRPPDNLANPAARTPRPRPGNRTPNLANQGIPNPRQPGRIGPPDATTRAVTRSAAQNTPPPVNFPPTDLPPELQRRSAGKIPPHSNPSIAAVIASRGGRSAAIPPPSDALTPGSLPANGGQPNPRRANLGAASQPDDSEAPVEMQVVTISTGDQRGADVMVQKGSSERFGKKPSLGIRTRGGIESNHTYLRFDLKSIQALKSGAKSAAIVLTVVDDQRPVGAVVRVIGIPDIEIWPENLLVWENSFSEQGLHTFPTLCETTVKETQSGPLHEIRIVSEELAKFIAASRKDTVTLAVAGSAPESQNVLRFVSRERSKSAAPRLMLRVPKEPPRDSRSGLRPPPTGGLRPPPTGGLRPPTGPLR